MLYLRNGMPNWHGMRGIWVDGMLDPHCDFELWPHPWTWLLIFKVKFWKCHISGMGGPVDIKWKECESIGCQTHIVILNCDHTYDLDPWFSRSNFEKVLNQECDDRLTWNKRGVSQLDARPTLWLWTVISPMTLTLDFQGQILKKSQLTNGMPDWHGTKGIWVNWMLDLCCDFQLWLHPWPWPWIFSIKVWNSCIPGMGGPIDMEGKGYESMGCYAYFVTLSYDLDLGFSRSNYNKMFRQWQHPQLAEIRKCKH